MNRLHILALALIVLVSRLLLLYRTGSPEPDSLAMLAGMTMALRGDIPLREAFLYGREGSPGMYLVGRFIYPLFFRSPENLLPFMNWVTVLASVSLVWPTYSIARRYFAPSLSAALVLVALLAPAVWDLSTYFHPEMCAAAAILLAIDLAMRAQQSRASSIYSVFAVLLGASAFLIRFHILFAAPGLLLAALLSQRRRYYLAIISFAAALAMVSYLALQTAVAGPEQHGPTGVLTYSSMIVEMYRHSLSVPGLTRSIVWATFGLGAATVLAVFAGALTPNRGRYQGSRRLVWVGLAWTIPALLFWLPQPTPILRHYVLPTFGLVLLLGVVVTRASRRHSTQLACLVLAANIAFPEVCYRIYNHRHSTAPKTPHGAVFYYHGVMQSRIARFAVASESVALAMSAPSSGGAVVLAQWEGYAHILFSLIQEHRVTREVRTTIFFPTVQLREYEGVGGHRLFFLNYAYFQDPNLQQRAGEFIQRHIDEGLVVFAPHELADGPLQRMLSSSGISTY